MTPAWSVTVRLFAPDGRHAEETVLVVPHPTRYGTLALVSEAADRVATKLADELMGDTELLPAEVTK